LHIHRQATTQADFFEVDTLTPWYKFVNFWGGWCLESLEFPHPRSLFARLHPHPLRLPENLGRGSKAQTPERFRGAFGPQSGFRYKSIIPFTLSPSTLESKIWSPWWYWNAKTCATFQWLKRPIDSGELVRKSDNPFALQTS